MKKEEVTGGILVQDAQDFTPREIETVDIIKAEPIKGGQVDEEQEPKFRLVTCTKSSLVGEVR